MRAYQILLEYDRQKTITNFGASLVNAVVEREMGFVTQIYPRERQAEAGGFVALLSGLKDGSFDGSDLLNAVVSRFEDYDPSKNKKFVPAMIDWYIKGSIRLEDLVRMKDALITYIKYKNRFSGLNLKTITFEAFEETMDQTAMQMSGSEMNKAEEQAYYDRAEAVLVHDDDEIKIVIPKTMAASCFFGKNTKWCTAARDKNSNMFSHYADYGDIYIILFKKENKRWQWHFGGNDESDHHEPAQFMDERDQPLDADEIANSKPARILIVQLIEATTLSQPELLWYLPRPVPENVVRAAISEDPRMIEFVVKHLDDIKGTNGPLDRAVYDDWIEGSLRMDADTIKVVPQTERNCLIMLDECMPNYLNPLLDIKDPAIFMKTCMAAAVRSKDVLPYVIATVMSRGIRHGPLEVVSVAFHPQTIGACPGYPDLQKMENYRVLRGGAGYDLLHGMLRKLIYGYEGLPREVWQETIQHTVLQKYGLPPADADLSEWHQNIKFEPQIDERLVRQWQARPDMDFIDQLGQYQRRRNN